MRVELSPSTVRFLCLRVYRHDDMSPCSDTRSPDPVFLPRAHIRVFQQELFHILIHPSLCENVQPGFILRGSVLRESVQYFWFYGAENIFERVLRDSPGVPQERL